METNHNGAAHSPTLGKFMPAYLAAKKEMGCCVAKDSTNPHFKNRYASLQAVLDAVTEPLLNHGIAVVQRNEPSHDGVTLVTELIHVSGEWIRSSLFLPSTKADAQGFGSALSYARRYGLQSVCGLAADDDDGEAAARPRSSPQAPASAPRQVETPKNIDTEATLAKLLTNATNVDQLAAAGVEVHKAVQAKSITDAARKRLQVIYGQATARLSAAQGAA